MILVPLGERTGLCAPVYVSALRSGTRGNRVAFVCATSSFSILMFLLHGRNPSFLIWTWYIPGSRLIVSSVAVVSSPLIYTCAPLGSESAESKPVDVSVPLLIFGRYPFPN